VNLKLPFARREREAFSLVEILIVVTLLSLIVLVLMGVFSSTQRAFRASVTQTDVLEGGRAVTDLIASDLRKLTPSGSYSNDAVNCFALDNNYSPAMRYVPMEQKLPASTLTRLNSLQYFFLLGRQNNKWVGIGYAVNVTNEASLYPLYRFYAETNLTQSPRLLYDLYWNTVNQGRWTNMSHLVDGVVHLVVRGYDAGGIWITNGYTTPAMVPKNVAFTPPINGEVGFYFYSNALPASVELQLGLLEDRAVRHAEALPTFNARTNYLAGQSGSVHLFRQQVNIPNADRAAY